MSCPETTTASTTIPTKCTNDLGYDTATVQTLGDTVIEKFTLHSTRKMRHAQHNYTVWLPVLREFTYIHV